MEIGKIQDACKTCKENDRPQRRFEVKLHLSHRELLNKMFFSLDASSTSWTKLPTSHLLCFFTIRLKEKYDQKSTEEAKRAVVSEQSRRKIMLF